MYLKNRSRFSCASLPVSTCFSFILLRKKNGRFEFWKNETKSESFGLLFKKTKKSNVDLLYLFMNCFFEAPSNLSQFCIHFVRVMDPWENKPGMWLQEAVDSNENSTSDDKPNRWSNSQWFYTCWPSMAKWISFFICHLYSTSSHFLQRELHPVYVGHFADHSNFFLFFFQIKSIHTFCIIFKIDSTRVPIRAKQEAKWKKQKSNQEKYAKYSEKQQSQPFFNSNHSFRIFILGFFLFFHTQKRNRKTKINWKKCTGSIE